MTDTTPTTIPAATAEPPRVLLVGRDERDRASLAVALARQGIAVVAAAGNAADALREFDRLRPAVVVADLELEEGSVDGLGLASLVRSRPGTAQVIVRTPRNDHGLHDLACQHGAFGISRRERAGEGEAAGRRGLGLMIRLAGREAARLAAGRGEG